MSKLSEKERSLERRVAELETRLAETREAELEAKLDNMHQTLRRRCIVITVVGPEMTWKWGCCRECRGEWEIAPGTPENHAPGCLAAPEREEAS